MKRETKIGLFLGVVLLIVALFIMFVGNIKVLFEKEGYPLYVDFDSVTGLDKRAIVRMAGVKIGYVKEIGLKDMRAHIRMDINDGTKIAKGSKATLASVGLLGEKHIEILPGEGDEYYQPGDTIEGIAAVSFDQLGTLLFSIGNEIKEVGKDIRKLIGKESRTDIKKTLESISDLTNELNDFFSANRKELGAAISKSSQTVQKLETQIDSLSSNLDELVGTMSEVIEENRENVKLNLENIKELISSTEESLKLIKEALEKISKGEGSLGKLVQKPDLYNKVEETINRVNDLAQPVSKLKLSGEFRLDYFQKKKDVKGYFSVDFWWTEKNFVLGQIVHNPSLEQFTYSLQAGIRWGAFSPRAGIIESKMGIGLDYYLFNDKLRLSLESFDFNRTPRPRFRFLTRYFASKKIYVLFGIDSFTLAPKRELFFGMGIDL